MDSMYVAQSLGDTFAEAATHGPLVLGILAAAVAGFVSFASPCVVPLVPGYISYLASIVSADVEIDSVHGPTVAQGSRLRVAGAACLFILGFTVVFVLATVTVFGAISALALNNELLMRTGGVVTIVMGVVFVGWVPVLQTERRFHPRKWSTWLGAPLLGGVFALGWTPCLGPTLAAIVSVSAGTEGMTAARGVALIIGYCLGLGLPFLFVALGSAQAMVGVGFLQRHSRTIQLFGGIALMVVGVALVTGVWADFINWIRVFTLEFGTTVI